MNLNNLTHIKNNSDILVHVSHPQMHGGVRVAIYPGRSIVISAMPEFFMPGMKVLPERPVKTDGKDVIIYADDV